MTKHKDKAAQDENATNVSVENPTEVEQSSANNVPLEQEVDEVTKLNDEIAELKDKNLRLNAEYQNYRKRISKDISASRSIGMSEGIMPFLQLFDLFGMAVVAAEKSDNVGAIQQGLNMIAQQYEKTLDELGVVKFDAVGTVFDPNMHDAVAYECSDDVPEGKVIKQWCAGYKLGGKLLRPARVVVSSGPAKAADKNDEEAQSKE